MIEFANSSLLANQFGHWPSFHDAEIRAVRLASPASGPPSLELDIEVAEMSDEVDEAGYYRTRHRCLVTMRFEEVVGANLADFGPQNVLDAVDLSELSAEERDAVGGFWPGSKYRVQCVPIPGFCEIYFTCESAAVTAVRELPASRQSHDREAAT
jgi:hypothetical protein